LTDGTLLSAFPQYVEYDIISKNLHNSDHVRVAMGLP
jgi:hypothetical protein